WLDLKALSGKVVEVSHIDRDRVASKRFLQGLLLLRWQRRPARTHRALKDVLKIEGLVDNRRQAVIALPKRRGFAGFHDRRQCGVKPHDRCGCGRRSRNALQSEERRQPEKTKMEKLSPR